MPRQVFMDVKDFHERVCVIYAITGAYDPIRFHIPIKMALVPLNWLLVCSLAPAVTITPYCSVLNTSYRSPSSDHMMMSTTSCQQLPIDWSTSHCHLFFITTSMACSVASVHKVACLYVVSFWSQKELLISLLTELPP